MRRGGTMRLRTGFLVHGQYPVVHLEDGVPSLVLLDYAVHHSPALAKELSEWRNAKPHFGQSQATEHWQVYLCSWCFWLPFRITFDVFLCCRSSFSLTKFSRENWQSGWPSWRYTGLGPSVFQRCRRCRCVVFSFLILLILVCFWLGPFFLLFYQCTRFIPLWCTCSNPRPTFGPSLLSTCRRGKCTTLAAMDVDDAVSDVMVHFFLHSSCLVGHLSICGSDRFSAGGSTVKQMVALIVIAIGVQVHFVFHFFWICWKVFDCCVVWFFSEWWRRGAGLGGERASSCSWQSQAVPVRDWLFDLISVSVFSFPL